MKDQSYPIENCYFLLTALSYHCYYQQPDNKDHLRNHKKYADQLGTNKLKHSVKMHDVQKFVASNELIMDSFKQKGLWNVVHKEHWLYIKMSTRD